MKLTFLMMCVFVFSLSARVRAQDQMVTLKVEKASFTKVISELKRQTQLDFFYSFNEENVNQTISLNVKNVKVDEVLQRLLGRKFTWEYIDRMVIIKPASLDSPEKKSLRVKGFVSDMQGIPIPGVTVKVVGTSVGTVTDARGWFQMMLPMKSGKLEFSFVGYKNKQIDFTEKVDTLRVMLEENVEELEGVVVTGMFTRRAESFTGSTATFKQEELKRAGNQNLLKSLKNLDPSFMILESLEFGSDPNRLPDIQMRGQTSFPNLRGDYEGKTNQPLFILDGFETTVEKVYDLDMNRVASVTLLKDAAAKAIYGAKAANGVVVIEMIRPVSGELRVSYSGDLNIEGPDLTGYNLMDAAEKLAFEKERGMYDGIFAQNMLSKYRLDELYKTNYDNVSKGVDTYWLGKPLRTGVGTKHSLMLEGGDERMRYQIGLSYNNVQGVMKGSDRNTLNLNATLSYTYKNLIFRNMIEYTRNWAKNSPYGSFSEYAVLNQYYQPEDENGNVLAVLGETAEGKVVYNPLYNATLNTKSESDYSQMTDNFNVDWRVSRAFRVVGSFSYSRQENSSDVFYPSSHTRFAEYDESMRDRKGQYTKGNGFSQIITAQTGINFNKTLDRHLFFANVTWNMSTNRTVASSFTAEGFGNDEMDNISFATQYQKNGKPSGTDSRTREIGIVGALNYSFADRYLFDASFRTTGSSMFGADNRWGAFWSLGAGWNVHHEKFLENNDWIRQLKLRASIGYTGSQDFDPYQARARYQYGNIVYNGRLGAELLGLPNNRLKWQRTRDINIGVDFALKRFLTGRFEYYVQTTNDLLSDITIVPSMGFSTYKENLGKIENKGYELSFSLTPWRSDEQRAWLTVTASLLHNENKIKEIHDIFDTWNEEQMDEKTEQSDGSISDEARVELHNAYTKPSTLYFEGQSMTAIWGVRSLGIDPMTGEEMFLDKNGNTVSAWSAADQVVIGDSNPKYRGNIGIGGGFRGFTFSVSCTYKLGGDRYNSTLVDKLENVDGFSNLDKRILESWREVGQKSQYRQLQMIGEDTRYTQPTSRFVQRENELYVSTINFGYDFDEMKWLRNLNIERLKLSFYMNEVLRLSTIKTERGTSYPFARNYSFSLQVTF